MAEAKEANGMDTKEPMVQQDAAENIYVELTYSPLDTLAIMNKVRSPKAGAIVLFAGTTRDTFASQPVKQLSYSAYAPLALRSLTSIAHTLKRKHSLIGIAMVHRLGVCPVGEESILIAVSSPHRKEGWLAGEEALELCKEKVEIWKMEEFEEGGGVWRANRDGYRGERVDGDGGVAQEKEELVSEEQMPESGIGAS